MKSNPLDELNVVKSVASFLAFTMDSASHHGFVSDMNGEDCRGLSEILSWISRKAEAVGEAVSEREAARDLDILKAVGLPEEAYADPNVRRAWQDGFSHGMAHGSREV